MRYAQIRKMDISNGQGVGVSLFVQGCPYHCKNCFNSETWDFDGGKEWTDEVQEQFLNLASKPYITRISLLGGEPLAIQNAQKIVQLLHEMHNRFGNTKKIWIYSGDTYEHLIQNPVNKEALQLCDVLVDGRYIDELHDFTLKFCGSSNQRVIDLQKTFKKGEIVLWNL